MSNYKFSLDPTNSIPAIDYAHHTIHEGKHFTIHNVFELGSLATMNFTFETKDKYVHAVYSVESGSAGFTMSIYEGATANPDGTLLTSINSHRISQNTSDVVARLNPTGTDITGATLLKTTRKGAPGNPSQRTPGETDRINEYILKTNTKYLMRITNLASAANFIDYLFDWYEEE